MILEKLPNSLNEDILLQTLLKYLLNLRLILRLKDGRLLLKQYTHAIQRQQLQRLRSYHPIQDEEELLCGDIPDKAVEHPWKDNFQGLDL